MKHAEAFEEFCFDVIDPIIMGNITATLQELLQKYKSYTSKWNVDASSYKLVDYNIKLNSQTQLLKK